VLAAAGPASATDPNRSALLIEHDGTPTPVRIRLSGPATARPAATARLQPSRLDFAAAGPPGVQSVSLLDDSAGRVSVGVLSSANCRANTTGTASDTNDYVLYETDTGKLFFDADGSGAGAKVLIATLTTLPVLTSADIFVT
jgi:hypothetical protein